MALSFPVGIDAFFGGLRIEAARIDLPSSVIASRTRGGETLVAEIGTRLWQGRAEIHRGHHGQADAVRARLAVLSGAAASFLVTPVHRAGPQADPFGAILGAASPVIHTLVAGNRELRISGLPVGYVLTAGDYLSFAYASAPTRYAFHQLVSGGVADGAGVTPAMEVTPHIRPGAVTGAAVVLVRPFFKAKIVAPATFGEFRRVFASGISFDFVQTLGA